MQAVGWGIESSILAHRYRRSLPHDQRRRFPQLIREAHRAQWDAALLTKRTVERLAKVCESARLTPHYGSAIGPGSDGWSIADLPFLHKEELALRAHRLLSPALGGAGYVRASSGTSGTLRQVFKPQSEVLERASIERRWLTSLALPDRFAITIVSPFEVGPAGGEPQRTPMFFHDWRIPLRLASIPQARRLLVLAAARGQEDREVIICSPHVAVALRDKIPESSSWRFSSSFEFAGPTRTAFGREQVEFECPTEIYSTSELSAPIAFRYPDCTSLHVNSDVVNIEIVDSASGASVPAGTAGSVIVTDLLNVAMPILRYDLGDVGLIEAESTCSCQRVTPRIRLIGRRIEEPSKSLAHLRHRLRELGLSAVVLEHDTDDFVVFLEDARDAARLNGAGPWSGSLRGCVAPMSIAKLLPSNLNLTVAPVHRIDAFAAGNA